MFSGGSLSEESVACRQNHSALRTTSACVHQDVFVNKLSLSTGRPSTIISSTSSIQSLISSVTKNTFKYFTTPRTSFNISRSSEEIEAEPLEPKPAIIDVLKNEANLVSSLTEVFYQSETNNVKTELFSIAGNLPCVTGDICDDHSLLVPGVGGDLVQAVPDLPASPVLPMPIQ